MLVGLQGSGKSSFYRQHFALTHTLVSKDLFPNNRNKARRQRLLIEEALRRSESVVVDNTNPTIAERAQAIALAQAFGVPVTGYVFQPDVAVSLLRNEAREGKARVPDVAIYATAAKWQTPTRSEGFSHLFGVTAQDGLFCIFPWKEP